MLGVLKPALMPVQGGCVVMCQTAAGSKRTNAIVCVCVWRAAEMASSEVHAVALVKGGRRED